MADVAVRWNLAGESGTPFGLQADALHTGQPGQLITPGTAGIDHDRGKKASSRRLDLPAIRLAGDVLDVGIAYQLRTGGPGTAQEALMDAMHVHVHGIGLVHAAGGRAGDHHRHALQDVGLTPPLNARHQCTHLLQGLKQGIVIIGIADAQGTSWAHQRIG
ncbi:hypothetical protein GALL_477740 [mine drainage metagenome]|uniref:Uncharacterized protein n=1 Tax=mine drainage metagenome TaxID=410659 RepID=A0A1J5PHA8_9ZZZZ